MGTMSHVITSNNFTLLHGRCSYGYSHSFPNFCTLKSARLCNKVGVFARFRSDDSTPECTTAVDFSDLDWKTKFKKDFEQRFRLPHVTDIFHDAAPMPSTFCLQMRTPLKRDFAGNYPSGEEWHGYINDNDIVLLRTIYYSSPKSAGAECINPRCSWVEQWVHQAGPRQKIYFKPEEVKAAIVTCGGLCPGLNDVIRQIVITLEIYGVEKIVGIPFGYRGFTDRVDRSLSRKVVQNIHLSGGSLLGVSRGGPRVSEIVDNLQERGINMLFVLGGNGTHAGANAIHDECRKRRIMVSVIGVPKTIDNDILLMDKTFGFDTAVEEAQRAINSAYIEVYFDLHGPNGVLSHLKPLIETNGSAVICVVEGAGQDLLQKTNTTDPSGNAVLGDIGIYIQQEEIGVHANMKYIDPTYMIRACRANASDGILCTVLGQNAVSGLQQQNVASLFNINRPTRFHFIIFKEPREFSLQQQ